MAQGVSRAGWRRWDRTLVERRFVVENIVSGDGVGGVVVVEDVVSRSRFRNQAWFLAISRHTGFQNAVSPRKALACIGLVRC